MEPPNSARVSRVQAPNRSRYTAAAASNCNHECNHR
jgi:hypothetical protein